MTMKIKELFKFPIERNIEPVVKVNDEDIEKVQQEIEEYVVTPALEKHYDQIFEKILDSKEQPTQNIGVWLSGFFGSGKSLFAKMLSYTLEGKKIGSRTASEIFLTKLENSMTKANLSTINSSLKIKSILFEIKSQEDQMNPDSITEILYRQFNKAFGFSEQVWIAELEKELTEANKYEEFKNEIKKETGLEWNEFRIKTLRLKPILYKVLKKIYPGVYENDEKIKESISGFEKLSLTPEIFSEKIKEYVNTKMSSKEKLFFIIDEMSQYVGDNSDKLLELQSIIENLGSKCKGRVWVIVTAQEKIDDVIEGVKRKKVEFAKISDRFSIRLTLTSENIDQVVKERILKKKDVAIDELKDRFSKKAGKLNNDINFRDWARAQLMPKLDEQSFVETYPFLPYQLKIIPEIFNNIRSKGAGYTKLSGRERSMLGAVHSVFNDPKLSFKDRKVGELVTFDMIYDEIAVELDGDTKRTIAETINLDEDTGEFINRVTKCLFLIQHLGERIPRNLTNIAMFLYDDIDCDYTKLKEKVQNALNKLIQEQYIIKDHSGYKFLSPYEKKIEEEIKSVNIKPGDKQRSIRNILSELFDVGKVLYKGTLFKVNLRLDGDPKSQDGAEIELKVCSSINQDLDDFDIDKAVRESFDNSQTIFWLASSVSGLNDKIIKFESLNIVLARKNQEYRNGNLSEEERTLILEKEKEQNNLKQDIIQDVKKSLVNGSIIYEGKEKKLDGRTEIKVIFNDQIEKIIPVIYHSFTLADVKAVEGDILDIFEKKLTGLAPVYKSLNLVDDSNNVNINAPIAADVLTTIKNKSNFGQSTLGKDILDHFSKRPYGWNPIVLRIVLATLFRNGTIIAQHQQRVYQDFTELGAKDLFRTINSFKSTKFEEAGEGDLTPEQRTICRNIVYEIFDERVGDTIDSLSKVIKAKTSDLKSKVERVQGIISSYSLPYDNKFAVVKRTVTRIDDQIIPTKIIQIFLEHAKELKETVPILLRIDNFGTDAQLKEFRRVKQFVDDVLVRFNPDKYDEISEKLKSESLIGDWNQIRREYERLFSEYKKEYDAALKERAHSFKELKKEIESQYMFKSLEKDEKEEILATIERKTAAEVLSENTITFNVAGESLEQIKENISSISSFKEQAIRKAIAAMQSKKEKAEASKLVYLNVGNLVSGMKIENEKELDKVVDKIKVAIEKELKQGKKVILG